VVADGQAGLAGANDDSLDTFRVARVTHRTPLQGPLASTLLTRQRLEASYGSNDAERIDRTTHGGGRRYGYLYVCLVSSQLSVSSQL
jgi:hypothetical protein